MSVPSHAPIDILYIKVMPVHLFNSIPGNKICLKSQCFYYKLCCMEQIHITKSVRLRTRIHRGAELICIYVLGDIQFNPIWNTAMKYIWNSHPCNNWVQLYHMELKCIYHTVATYASLNERHFVKWFANTFSKKCLLRYWWVLSKSLVFMWLSR